MAYPVLFLDFDGVLNKSSTKTRFTFPDGETYTGLDPRNVERLNAICRAVPDARIVVSSSWRTSLDLNGLRDALAERGFGYPDRVVDVTPQWRVENGNVVGSYETRPAEIQAWLDAQQTPPSRIAILDDCEPMKWLTSRLVMTDMWGGGLLDKHVDRVVRLLSSGDGAA